MSNKELINIGKNIIKFKSDKPFRMFVGEIDGDTVKKISPDEIEGFKNGDKVVVMHGEDWLWFFNELTDATKSK
jgi:predicted phosphodiesterase